MSNNSNKQKEKHLGMPYGTANGRLRKMIMFELVKETNKDSCFRCGIKIESIEDLTIEHKEPWLHNDADLFWAWSNIAFSHVKCNKVDRPNNGRSKPSINGMSWCSGHKEYLPTGSFHKNKARHNGIQAFCKECK